MALLDILIPQLMNCGQNANQTFTNVMDQDWNHWKLQLQSWMEDAKEAAGQPGATASAAPTCGASANQESGCSGNPTESDAPHSPYFGDLWSQFVGARHQNRRTAREEASNNLVKNGQRKYIIKLDVQHFEPNEITVKIVGNQIVVDGEHSERSDRMGRVSRKFQRKYDLPDEVEPNSIVSTLTSSGVLIIEGLKKRVPNESGSEIVIPVIRETNDSGEDQSQYQNDQKMD